MGTKFCDFKLFTISETSTSVPQYRKVMDLHVVWRSRSIINGTQPITNTDGQVALLIHVHKHNDEDFKQFYYIESAAQIKLPFIKEIISKGL